MISSLQMQEKKGFKGGSIHQEINELEMEFILTFEFT
jgi:hypothetical protein